MSFTIGVIDLRHEVYEGFAFVHICLKQRRTINDSYPVFRSEFPHLLCVLIQGIFRIVQIPTFC